MLTPAVRAAAAQMKFLVPAEHAKASGIYIIRNSINTKVYVGSASHFSRRFSEHKNALKRGEHHSSHLQGFVNKYGIQALSFECLEVCEADALLSREQFYLNNIKCFGKHGFNTCSIANSCKGIKRSAETKAKLSAALKGKIRSEAHCAALKAAVTPEARAAISARNAARVRSQAELDKLSAKSRGRIASAETKAKMSAAHTGKKKGAETLAKMSAAFKGRVFSEETKAKMRASAQLRWHGSNSNQGQLFQSAI